jgi:hypothetical protein
VFCLFLPVDVQLYQRMMPHIFPVEPASDSAQPPTMSAEESASRPDAGQAPPPAEETSGQPDAEQCPQEANENTTAATTGNCKPDVKDAGMPGDQEPTTSSVGNRLEEVGVDGGTASSQEVPKGSETPTAV